jgi:hypothetical protein
MDVDARHRTRPPHRAQDRSTRFFGTDFSFEDLEERDVDQFDYKLAGDDTIDGAACWKIESKPKQSKSSQYTSSLVWVRKDNYVVAQIEDYSKDKLIRRIHYSDIQNVSGIWTPRTVEVYDANRKSRTILKLEKLEYNVPMKDEDFTLEALRRGRLARALLPALLCSAAGGGAKLHPARIPGNQPQLYPETAPNDSSHAIDDDLFRYEASYKPWAWLRSPAPSTRASTRTNKPTVPRIWTGRIGRSAAGACPCASSTPPSRKANSPPSSASSSSAGARPTF